MDRDFSASTLSALRQGTRYRFASLEEFLDSFESMVGRVERLLADSFHLPAEQKDAVLEMIRYNVLGGKMIRGLFSVYSAYAMSEAWDTTTKEQWDLLDRE